MIVFLFLFAGMSFLMHASGIKLKAVKVEKGPSIDGHLDDDCWKNIPPFTDFKTIEPQPGLIPSENTELRIVYDDKNLYIGVYCASKNGNSISIASLQYDTGEDGNDIVKILLDPFQDKRNAYVFMVNAGGARTDGLAVGESFSTNWDGIWDASSKITKDGWSSEIKIPFKTISFNSALKEWGFNLERIIPSKQETIRLSGISRDSFFNNPAEAALMEGMEPRKQGLGITFKPYATLDTKRDYKDNEKREWKLNGGFDLYKNFTPNLVGVLTYHTDFAETEVDDRQINLTRFPLFFPEKRSFFLEGSEIFSFGMGMGETFTPFFSRRIGLRKGEQIPVEWGAKVFGKIGNTNIALLDVRTEAKNGIPAENFFAGRISQNIFSQSKVGVIFTSGNPNSTHSNTLFGIDFTYSTSRFLENKNFAAGAWWVRNTNEISGGNHSVYGFKIDYPNDFIDAMILYNCYGDAMDPGLGFIARRGIKTVFLGGMVSPRPKNGSLSQLIRRFSFGAYGDFYWDMDGKIESWKFQFSPMGFRTQAGDTFEFWIAPQRDILKEPFEVSDNIIIPIGDYKFTSYNIEIETATHRMISGELEYDFGNFYNGKLKNLELNLSMRYKGKLILSASGNFVNGNLPAGNFKEKLYRAKIDYFPNPDIGVSTYIQYDSVSKDLGANIRLKWELSPGNTIYLVYNKNWEKGFESGSRFYPFQDRGIIKLQFSIRP